MDTNISIDKLMDFYMDTLQKCGVYLLDMEDEDIEYNIFEEFDINVVSFLHQNTLSKLKDANLISEQIVEKSIELREKYLAMQNTEACNVESVRNNKEWRNILELSDNIKSLIDKNNF
ncbi:hypothetical protein CLHUN_32530 [Ruminiclostridium hungatei]|uniref:Uncharacterized protein n=1 Tax=Ruminiclostridium hungatei TaxID=48256 RepID=A0A1V4SGB3_RUMHU|nr:hypothetical protein [Ruminiclostridium hungatei]OPX42929.1 hypothetical protein CLHUN_32530 [Ruminiclostridium hungatei]